jgi:hypothetical protein
MKLSKYSIFFIFSFVPYFTLLFGQVHNSLFYGKEEIVKKNIKFGSAKQVNTFTVLSKEVFNSELNLTEDSTYPLWASVYRVNDDITRPLVVFAFGGGYIFGSKDKPAIINICTALARAGYVVAAIDYRTSAISTASFLKAGYIASQDMRSAIRYFSYYSNDLRINKNKIFLAGISSGACTAIMSSFYDPSTDKILERRDIKYSELFGPLNEANNTFPANYLIKGVINISGAVHDLSILNKNIPIFSVTGDNDKIINHESDEPFSEVSDIFNEIVKNAFGDATKAVIPKLHGSLDIHNYILKRGGKTTLKIIEGSGHYIMFDSNGSFTSDGKNIIQEIISFLYKQ